MDAGRSDDSIENREEEEKERGEPGVAIPSPLPSTIFLRGLNRRAKFVYANFNCSPGHNS